MGVKNLRNLIKTNVGSNDIDSTIKLDNLAGQYILIDTSIVIYQHVLGIRNKGSDLTNKENKITSHLHAIFFKSAIFMKHKINPIFVFDGKCCYMKDITIANREKMREHYIKKLKQEKLKAGEEVKYFKRTFSLTDEQIDECKYLLTLMGIPFIESIEEADSQCAYLAKKYPTKIFGVLTTDSDILTFGSPRIIKYKKDKLKVIELENILKILDINYKQFVDLCILLGTDYIETIPCIGFNKAYKLIVKYGCIERISNNNDYTKRAIKVRNYFMNPVADDYKLSDLKYKKPDIEKIKKFMINDNDFNKDTINKYLEIIYFDKL